MAESYIIKGVSKEGGTRFNPWDNLIIEDKEKAGVR